MVLWRPEIAWPLYPHSDVHSSSTGPTPLRHAMHAHFAWLFVCAAWQGSF